MRIEAIDVGDGACAVVSDTDSTTDLTMIDCGRRPGGDAIAAVRARDYLSERLGDVTTLVVTHFDQDHWGGLRVLADAHATLRPKKNAPPVEIRVPGMPDAFARRLREGMLALISVRDGVPVNAMELLDTWRASGATVHQTVHYAGDEFEANGIIWKVLWPPHQVPADMGRTITTWLDDLHDLARDMEQHGRPELIVALRRAYSEVERFNGSTAWAEAVPESPVWRTTSKPLREGPPADDDSQPEAEEATTEGAGFEGIPQSFMEKLTVLARRMNALDNALSLVVADAGAQFIGFGDIEDKALEGLRSMQSVDDFYVVMLAPHHGTHRAPSWLPAAAVCISQNGMAHHRKNHLHRSTHTHFGRCISTWDRGNIDADTDDWFRPRGRRARW